MIPVDDALPARSIRALAAGYRNRSWSTVDVVSAALTRIGAMEPELHAWALIDADRARASAERTDREFQSGPARGLLHGVPIGVKDIFDVAGLPTRCGSPSRADAPPAERSAASVDALLGQGAIVLGKTVTQEFAAGVISAPARNPWDRARIPGGSSGGSAVAIASGACLAAMGSDTGGSIRIPAAACGVVGFKPAFGQIPEDGVYPLAWSLDTVGPLARGVDDAWIVWRSLLGDPAPAAIGGSVNGLKVGIPRRFFYDWLAPGVRGVIEAAIDALARQGAVIVETDWHDAEAARAAAFVINRVETASVHEGVVRHDPERFARYGQDLQLRVAAGLTLPASLYLQATRVREIVRDSVARLFADAGIDALFAPTLPTTAVRADTLAIDGTGLAESIGAGWTRLTMPFNATGQPVLGLPIGLDPDGLPVGAQLVGRPGDESALFRLGLALEDAVAQTTVERSGSVMTRR